VRQTGTIRSRLCCGTPWWMIAAAAVAILAACGPAAESDSSAEAMSMDEEMQEAVYVPQFTANGELRQPPEALWRYWPQIGTPLTPNALNGGEAAFPEFHQVYIDPVSWEHWKATGEFRDGTVLAKELVSVLSTDAMEDGSTRQVSGRGYFMDDFVGFEIAYKSAEHFPDDPGNWAYFTFGHHPPPYASATSPMPLEACSSCHQANADDDFVFTQFYPLLRAGKGPGM